MTKFSDCRAAVICSSLITCFYDPFVPLARDKHLSTLVLAPSPRFAITLFKSVNDLAYLSQVIHSGAAVETDADDGEREGRGVRREWGTDSDTLNGDARGMIT